MSKVELLAQLEEEQKQKRSNTAIQNGATERKRKTKSDQESKSSNGIDGDANDESNAFIEDLVSEAQLEHTGRNSNSVHAAEDFSLFISSKDNTFVNQGKDLHS